MEENALTPNEQKAFDKLRKKSVLPHELEDKTVSALRSKNLLTQERERSVQLSWLLRIAASILLFSSGYFMHWYLPTNDEVDYTYVLLLHEDESFQADDSQSRFQEYAQWMNSVEAANTSIAGEKLSDELVFVGSKTHDSSADRVTGYMVVTSATKEGASEIAMSSPHVKYGGYIEVRKIVHE